MPAISMLKPPFVNRPAAAPVQFSANVRILSSVLTWRAKEEDGIRVYQGLEQRFDKLASALAELPDGVDVAISAESYHLDRDKGYHALCDVAKITLTSRYGETITEHVKGPAFRYKKYSEYWDRCPATNKAANPTNDADLNVFVGEVMSRLRHLCAVFKPGYVAGAKDC